MKRPSTFFGGTASIPSRPAKKPASRPKPNGHSNGHADPMDAAPDAAPNWRALCQINRQGTLLSNVENACVALAVAPELSGLFSFDEMLQAVLINGPVPQTERTAYPRPVTDTDVTGVQKWLQRGGLHHLSSAAMAQAINFRASQRAFHPVREYLEGLEWDRMLRLDGWLANYLGAPTGDYAENIGRMFLVSMVARIFRPGCKADHMLVLEDEQGAGKSTACSVLGAPWFSDSLPELHRGDAVRLSMHLRGKWLIEISELSAIGRAEAGALKAFLSQTEERYTPKFGHYEVIEPRQCVFIGTTNKHAYLRDETGGRRFWPIKCGTIDAEGLARARDQLFAEAVWAYRNGVPWWPDRAFEAAHIKPEQDSRYESDVWEDAIRAYLDAEPPDYAGESPKVATSIWEIARKALSMQDNRIGTADTRRIGAALEQLGWRRGKHTKHGLTWVRPGRPP